jgi:predicted transcriptional regulator
MPPTDRSLFISVRPQYAELLLSGEKRIELRRTAPDVQAGALVLIYASSPVCALVGTAIVEDITVGSPRTIWTQARDEAAVTRAVFDAYFEGATLAVAIALDEVKRLRRPVPLRELRAGRAWFSPPQSFRYLDPQQLGSLGVRRRVRGRQLQLSIATG